MLKNSSLKSFLWYQMPAIFMAAIIFTLSSFSKLPHTILTFQWQDKFAHAFVYSLLSYLIARALFYQYRFPAWQKNYLWLAILLAILYGVSDEIHQYFVPGRSSEFYDIVADAVGACLGVLGFRFRTHLKRILPV